MTQVTGVQEFFEAMVEVRPAGGAWTDISGWGATVAVSGRERQVGEGFTHDGDHAIVGHGKLQPLDVTVRAIYTEGGLDPYAIVLPPLENHTVLQVRWSPYGGQVGEKQYTTNLTHSHVINCPAPSGEAGSGDPIMLEFTVRTSDIAEAEIITSVVILFNATQLARSTNFYEAPPHTPTWVSIKTGLLAGANIGIIRNCALASNGTAWVLTYKDEATLADNGIFYCADVLAVTPVWDLIQSLTAYRASGRTSYPQALAVDDNNVFYTQASGVQMYGYGTSTVTWDTSTNPPATRPPQNTQNSVGKVAGISGVRGSHSPGATPGKAIITMNGGSDTLVFYSTAYNAPQCVAGNHMIPAGTNSSPLYHYTDSAVLNGSTVTQIYADADFRMPVVSDGVNVLTVQYSTGDLMNLAVDVSTPLAAFGAARSGGGFCFGLAGYGEIIWLATNNPVTTSFIAMRDALGIWVDKTGDFNTAIGAWGGNASGITPMPITISVS